SIRSDNGDLHEPSWFRIRHAADVAIVRRVRVAHKEVHRLEQQCRQHLLMSTRIPRIPEVPTFSDLLERYATATCLGPRGPVDGNVINIGGRAVDGEVDRRL